MRTRFRARLSWGLCREMPDDETPKLTDDWGEIREDSFQAAYDEDERGRRLAHDREYLLAKKQDAQAKLEAPGRLARLCRWIRGK